MSSNNAMDAGLPAGPVKSGTKPPPAHPLIVLLPQLGQRVRLADRRRPWVLDLAVIVALFLAFCLPEPLLHVYQDGPSHIPIRITQPSAITTTALQIGLLLPLMARRRAPSAAFSLIMAVLLVQWSLGVFLRADVTLLVALYSVTLHGCLRQLPWCCTAVVGLLLLLVGKTSAAVSYWEALFFLLSVVTAVVGVGFAVRIRRAQLAGLRERAARLEVERNEHSRQAAAAERARMSREMHDIIDRNLSVIITLADNGVRTAEGTPERRKEVLRLVRDAGRQALGELRRTPGVPSEHRNGLPSESLR